MTDDDLFPMMRRSLGSALVTGASGASIALHFARPAANDALVLAYEAAVEARKSALDGTRAGLRSARAGAAPSLHAALQAKDQLRRRAVGMLPPEAAKAAEGWRQRFIEGEKFAYYGSQALSRSLEPARELAMARSRSMLADAVNAFGEVAEVALATSIRFGEEMQRGAFEPPKPKGAKEPPSRKASRRKPRARTPP
jgi:hypothetical protein